MPPSDSSDADLRQLLASLEILRPQGWPAPDFVPKPPFDPAAVTMPAGWVWGESTFGDALDALGVIEAKANHETLTSSPMHTND
jgi:hypothetical protein